MKKWQVAKLETWQKQIDTQKYIMWNKWLNKTNQILKIRMYQDKYS